jgi:uncharacterized membrane protein YfcA
VLVLTLAAAVLIGVTLGVLGGGGSILTVPILVYLAGLDAKHAIAMSLFVVGVTSAIGAIPHARAGRVRWRTALLFGATAMAGAYGGGRLAAFIPGGWLLAGFGVMMLATAVAMLRERRDRPAGAHHEPPVLLVVTEGIVVGAVTGLVGAGGGFLVVPALVLLGGLPMAVAVGTSLVVIAVNALMALALRSGGAPIDWTVVLPFVVAAAIGTVLGARLGRRYDAAALSRWFAVGLVVVAIHTMVTAIIGLAG